MASRVFVDSDDVDGAQVRIHGAAARHLAASLRARPGELVVVVEDARIEHGVVLREVDRDVVAGDIVWSRPATGEPGLQVHVLQAISQRGMDEAVEAMAQLGAASIRPMVTRRTVRRLDAEAARRRLARWTTVAHEGAQLAGRARAPEVHAPASAADALALLPADAEILVATLRASRPLARGEVSSHRPLVLCIGPEGGFDEEELTLLRDAGAAEVHLGSRVLPAHLAGAVALGLVLAASGDLDAPPTPAPKI